MCITLCGKAFFMCSGAFGAWGKVCLAYAREKLYNGKMDEKIRINKYLSEAGFCSRREADSLIRNGRVTVEGHMQNREKGLQQIQLYLWMAGL